ncbi:MAG: hypothetical protein WC375_05665 [Methanomassiliicoccales archaeon]|jgi:hypothetical protein
MLNMPDDIIPLPIENEKTDIEIIADGTQASSDFQSPVQYEKLPVPVILDKAKEIDPKKIAEEILNWAIANVESYVDNHRKIYKLDLILDSQETMLEAKKLQDLYRAIPDDSDRVTIEDLANIAETLNFNISGIDEKFGDIIHCRDVLDTITLNIHEILKASSAQLDELFSRLIFFYELKGVKEGNLLIQDMKGMIDVLRFEYESFPVGVRIRAPQVVRRDENGQVVEVSGESVKEYVIPEGFTLWLELAFRPKIRQTSLF